MIDIITILELMLTGVTYSKSYSSGGPISHMCAFSNQIPDHKPPTIPTDQLMAALCGQIIFGLNNIILSLVSLLQHDMLLQNWLEDIWI